MIILQNSIKIFLAGEVLSLLLFSIIRKCFPDGTFFRRPDIETFKGILERLVLFIGLINNFVTVLVVFGALKLGTKLKPEDENHGTSNNYFLVGNFMSLLVAMVDTAIVNKAGAEVVTISGIIGLMTPR